MAARRRTLSFLLASIAVSLIMAACAAGPSTSQTHSISDAKPPIMPPVKDNLNHELVTFMGDSITFYWDDPAWVPEDDLLSSHLPMFIDAGINGQTSVQMLARFATDILDKHPGTIVIDAGTNDVDYLDVNQSANTTPGSLDPDSMKSLFAMAEMAVASGAYVIVGTLPPQDFAGTTQIQQQLHAQWNEGIRAGAATYGYTVAEFYDVMIDADGTQNAALFAIDKVHPNGAGYAVMWGVLAPLLNVSTQAH